MEQLVKDIYLSEEYEIFHYTESENYPRFRISFPEPVLDFLIENFFTKNNFFKEELLYLNHINKEQLIEFSDLENIIIKENLSLLEFIKLRRFFSFFYLLFSKKIYEIENVDIDTIFRSLVPTFKEEILYKYLGRILSAEKVDSFIDLIYWEPNLDILFDLQYHPIIYLNNNFIISHSVLYYSNFIRNLYASEYKKQNKQLLKDGVTDPLVLKLSNSLNNSNICNFINTKLPNAEIDLFAYMSDTLYIFECKHTLQPVNPFDLRTTYDYIKKAEKQLDKIKEFSNKNELIPHLEKKYSINLSQINHIVYAIVLSNRIFNGDVFNYPVRFINEVANMLETGLMKTEYGNYSLWKSTELSNEDLLEYFSPNNKLVDLYFDSLIDEIIIYELMQPVLEVETVYLDLDYAKKKLETYTSSLRKIET